MDQILPDCTRILPRLYQGVRPPADGTLAIHGFDLVVLTAVEYQPRADRFAGIAVLRCPIDDDYDVELRYQEKRLVFDTAARVTHALRAGARCYVSCQAGLNRSGLVTALVVRDVTGSSGREAKQWVQSRRPLALRNPNFVRLLDALPRPNSARAEFRR